jgi:tRNA uridine 5-carboxymethylaminomethyl modification enzyme
MQRVQAKKEAAEHIEKVLRDLSVEPGQVNGLLDEKGSSPISQKVKLHGILLRPQIKIEDLRKAVPQVAELLKGYEQEFVDLAETNMKYEGYIRREQEMVDKMNRLEEVHLHEDFNYQQLASLSNEAREKLSRMKPRTIGQASRISGVSPADISVLLVHVGR